jgi:hypothetical protein
MWEQGKCGCDPKRSFGECLISFHVFHALALSFLLICVSLGASKRRRAHPYFLPYLLPSLSLPMLDTDMTLKQIMTATRACDSGIGSRGGTTEAFPDNVNARLCTNTTTTGSKEKLRPRPLYTATHMHFLPIYLTRSLRGIHCASRGVRTCRRMVSKEKDRGGEGGRRGGGPQHILYYTRTL